LYSTCGVTREGKNPFLLMKSAEVVTIVESLSVNTIPARELRGGGIK
jgi:hypothetical protein